MTLSAPSMTSAVPPSLASCLLNSTPALVSSWLPVEKDDPPFYLALSAKSASHSTVFFSHNKSVCIGAAW